jgi:hypothetical protein
LIDQLQAYSPHTNPIYYTTIFIDGLCGDIKFLIVVQRLKDLDTAYYLALLQEETTSSHGKTYKIADVGGGGVLTEALSQGSSTSANTSIAIEI